MSIPLDRLYHYIESVAQEITSDNVIIYRFFPHGSKKIEDLSMLSDRTWEEVLTKIQIFCYDQEPLNYKMYENEIRVMFDPSLIPELGDTLDYFKVNIRSSPNNVHDKCLLLHSELNSPDVQKYSSNQFIPVYYWSHAFLARDWYRYAQHITCDSVNTTFQKKFLVYNRAWSGSREYRLKLADLLVEYNLVDQCVTSCSFIDPNSQTHYSNHKFTNEIWKPARQLENYYNHNSFSGTASADFDISDYASTGIELVLETLFDDPRIQLTEKILRPIAMGKPFMLLGPAGSLEYLRSYGFQTFEGLIDESYDRIQDPLERMKSVLKTMADIKNLSTTQYQTLIKKLTKISNKNKKYFFSEKFFKRINNELSANLRNGIHELLTTDTYHRFVKFRHALTKNKSYMQLRSQYPKDHREKFDSILQQVTQLANK